MYTYFGFSMIDLSLFEVYSYYREEKKYCTKKCKKSIQKYFFICKTFHAFRELDLNPRNLEGKLNVNNGFKVMRAGICTGYPDTPGFYRMISTGHYFYGISKKSGSPRIDPALFGASLVSIHT